MSIERHEQNDRWSKLVVRDNTAYLAGLIAEDWDGDIKKQTTEVFKQIDNLLAKAGTDKSRILTLMVYIKDLADYAQFNEIYDQWIDRSNLPARATVKADLIDPRLRIEIVTIAAV